MKFFQYFQKNRANRSPQTAFNEAQEWNDTNELFKGSQNKSFLSLGLFLIAFGLFFGLEKNSKCLFADTDTLPTNYCYVSNILVGNTGSTEANELYPPVRIEYPYISWKQNAQIDKAHSSDFDTSKFWDVRGYSGSITNQFEIFASDIRNNAKGTYYLWGFPKTINSGANDLSLFHGNQYEKRDQGIYFFNDNSKAFAVDHNDLDLSNEDWLLKVRTKFIPSKLNDGDVLVGKYDEDLQTGYKIEVYKSSTTGSISFECISDNSQVTTPISIPSSEDFTQIHLIEMEKSTSGSIKCGLDGVFTGGTSIVPTTPTQESFKIAENFNNAFVYDVKLWHSTTPIVFYLFNAWETEFNSQTSNSYSYTIKNALYNNNTHPLSYLLESDQSKYAVEIQNAVSVFDEDLPPSATLSYGSISEGFMSDNFYDTPTIEDKNSFQVMLGMESDYIPLNLLYGLIFVSTGLSLGALGFVFSKSVMLASFLSGIPIAFGVSMDFLPEWYLLFYGIILVMTFGMKEFGR